MNDLNQGCQTRGPQSLSMRLYFKILNEFRLYCSVFEQTFEPLITGDT